eukprot:CAMPEP_0180421424 /NCGR_PEP_ID=MMETSP1036_2-20121128/3144_1 /TAXON_ID=632150 /ORGANISM="Azadinium spinosum, Strain 3D9" /LENGTH=109 /DNA_ID=CAMNT_0022426689 /DNA_START=725 /DNA_END=1054 /DNA_ORIENTATION=-
MERPAALRIAEAQRHHMAVSAVAKLINIIHRRGRDLGEQHVAKGALTKQGRHMAAVCIIWHHGHRVAVSHPALTQHALEQRACDLVKTDGVSVQGRKLLANRIMPDLVL